MRTFLIGIRYTYVCIHTLLRQYMYIIFCYFCNSQLLVYVRRALKCIIGNFASQNVFRWIETFVVVIGCERKIHPNQNEAIEINSIQIDAHIAWTCAYNASNACVFVPGTRKKSHWFWLTGIFWNLVHVLHRVRGNTKNHQTDVLVCQNNFSWRKHFNLNRPDGLAESSNHFMILCRNKITVQYCEYFVPEATILIRRCRNKEYYKLFNLKLYKKQVRKG